MKLTKSQFPNKEWPFTVDTVYVTMKESGGLKVLLIRFHIVRYALNGTAANYGWKGLPKRYRSMDNDMYFVNTLWFIKYCLDNVKKS